MEPTNPVPKKTPPGPPDLQTQFESLLHEVWIREAEWRFEERLQNALASLRSERRSP